MALSEEQKTLIKAASDKTFPFVERCGVKTLDVERGYCKMMMPLAILLMVMMKTISSKWSTAGGSGPKFTKLEVGMR